MHFDCIVVGLGGMGSSTLYHLTQRGQRVCGIEQFGRGHQQGSSHGEFRVFRKAYFEHPDYVPLLQEAEHLWRDLEARSGTKLYQRIGVVLSGPANSEAIAGTRDAAATHDLPIHNLDAAESRQRWPLLGFRDSDDVVLDQDAGILAVEECVEQHLQLAIEGGATAIFGSPVRSWTADERQVQVEITSHSLTADRIVFSSGAWTAPLLNSVLPPMTVLRKAQMWHAVSDGLSSQLAELPAFFFDTSTDTFYGMPTGNGAIKLARHSRGLVVPDPTHADELSAEEERQAISTFASQRLCGLATSPIKVSDCLYTVSPDGHFIVDRHPQLERVCFAAGFSGHGFKFASVIGSVLADLMSQGGTSLPIDFLGLQRFR